MAESKEGNTTDLNSIKVNSYTKGLIKDYNDSYVPEGVWTNAINAVTNSHLGDMFTISNEPSNEFCTQTLYEVIGIIRKDADEWFIFSTDDNAGEIGTFKETDCSYTMHVRAACLNFKRSNLITGATQRNYDCTYTVFFADGLNPDRAFNPDKIPYIVAGYDLSDPNCPVPIYDTPPRLDCNKIRLQYLITVPCFSLQNSNSPGTLFNGTYQVTIAYTISGQRVTDYFALSNAAAIWSHENNGSSLDLVFTAIDTNFEEYEVVLISTVSEATTARRVGFYSTTQTTVHIDDNTAQLPTIPLEDIPVTQAIYDVSDGIYSLNFYLLRSGVKTKPEFNYQPLANLIVAKWVNVEYPADYYIKGNNNTGYMRDEVYSFFIRWVYNTGDKTASYHIPGRPIRPVQDGTLTGGNDVLPYDNNGSVTAPTWKVYNTAFTTSNIGGVLPDGGVITATGYMGYWESTEKYPIKPAVWNSNEYSWSATPPLPYPWSVGGVGGDYDLCGNQIRHHKFPDETLCPIFNSANQNINLLGVRFENIKAPVDQQGNPIAGIVGYEILRGSREGNKSIVAKGLVYNMFQYTDPASPGTNILYQNYPYNCLQPDYFLRSGSWYTPAASSDHDDTGSPMQLYKKDYFSFHSPDLTFRGAYLNPSEFKITKEYIGSSTGSFVEPFGHPKQKIPTYGAFIGAMLIGLGMTIMNFVGQKQTTAGNVTDPTVLAANTAAGAAGLAGGGVAAASAVAAGATGWSGGTFLGLSSGTTTSLQLPTVSSSDTPLSALNFTSKKGGIVFQVLSLLQQINMIASAGGYMLAQNFGNVFKAFKELLPWVQYARQWNSVGNYNNAINSPPGNMRRIVNRARYVTNSAQQFDASTAINNINRPKAVIINTAGTYNDPSNVDVSRRTINQRGNWDDPGKTWIDKISAYYGALKIHNPSQYNQIASVAQVPIGTCVQPAPATIGGKVTSQIYFGGDVYINRYTELNKFPYFTNWLYDQPDGTDIDYKTLANIPYPRYWVRFQDFDLNDVKFNNFPPSFSGSGLLGLIQFLGNLIGTFIQFVVTPAQAIANTVSGPNQFFHLDRKGSVYNVNLANILKFNFYVKNGYFYLFNNGVKNFYCESEVNVACRDYGEQIAEQFYNPYGYSNISNLFRTDLITVPEFYKYDFSMSVGKLLSSYISWGTVLPIGYDPNNQACFEYFPNRLIYSLQQQFEQSRDNWRIFLANNYKDFENQINNVKPINRTGAVILFEDAIPTTINGVDELRTSAGNRITVGDAGLFNQSFQNLVNADLELEYGSCQSERSVINTPYGVFWISQRTGKVMQLFNNQITDIAMNGMRFWFIENLPYNLLKQFPTYPHTDNPVWGVGCQAVYDNQFEIVYFMKRDYKLADPSLEVEYDSETDEFLINGYSYSIQLSYGVSSTVDIKNGSKISGSVNGQAITFCTYTAPNINAFVDCLITQLEARPNIKKVTSVITAYNFTLTILLDNNDIPAIFNLFIIPPGLAPDPIPLDVDGKNKLAVYLTDPNYFEDCSWTVSYDPKTKMWISFHDWHPDLTFPTNDHFFTILDNTFWKHNVQYNSYSNFYSRNYGWEVEFPVNTQTSVTTIKSVEYYLEVFKYNISRADRYHVLDGNFDHAILYNTEQVSGLLNLNLKPKANPAALLTYPKINTNLTSIDILVAKEENKYRFNQFWDTARDRGEFSGLQITNFITECNGYRMNINPGAVNYFKSPLERKKFRHYGNRVILRKMGSGAEKMNLKVVATKETLSPR
jgi:hypothetical protein